MVPIIRYRAPLPTRSETANNPEFLCRRRCAWARGGWSHVAATAGRLQRISIQFLIRSTDTSEINLQEPTLSSSWQSWRRPRYLRLAQYAASSPPPRSGPGARDIGRIRRASGAAGCAKTALPFFIIAGSTQAATKKRKGRRRGRRWDRGRKEGDRNKGGRKKRKRWGKFRFLSPAAEGWTSSLSSLTHGERARGGRQVATKTQKGPWW
jgi:hypothetical protein